MPKQIKLYSRDQIAGQIVSIQRAGARLQDNIHKVGVSILKVWHDGKEDYATAQWAAEQLTLLMGASPYHGAAVAKWIGMFTPALWAEKTKTWYVKEGDCRLMGKDFMSARDNPFWKVKPPTAPKPFDMWAELEKIINRAAKHGEKPVEGDDIDPAVVRELRSILAKREA